MTNSKIIIKKKFSFIKLSIVLLILYIIFYLAYDIVKSPIKNIYIFGNNILSDQEIIDISGLRNYPSFLLSNKSSIKKKLLKEDVIKSVDISKEKYGEIHITIKEYKPLFYNKNTNKTVLESGIETDVLVEVPILINYMDETILNKLVKKMNIVSDDILLKISEIEYKPSDKDSERISLTMTDGNYVFLTLYKFEKINYYNQTLPSLEGKKGTLNLDSGNYFKY